MKHANVNMLEGSITKGLLSMMLPIMFTNVMSSLFNIIDKIMLKEYCGDDNVLGAVSVCGTLITLATTLIVGVSVGANIVAARRTGAKDRAACDRAVNTSLIFALVSGIIISAIGVIFAKTFLGWVNCSETLLEKATLYFRLYFLGIPIMMFYTFCAAMHRAFGDIRRNMYISLTCGFLKVVFTYISVAHLDLTVDGVAYATLLSQLIAAILSFTALKRSRDYVTISFKTLRFDFKEFREMIYIGIPAGLQTALYSFANVMIAATVNSYGDAATTGVGIANDFDGLIYQIIAAPSVAVISYVAQNMGAKNIPRVKQTLVKAIFITTAFGGVLGFLSAFFSRELASLMSSTPSVIEYANQKMVIVSSTYFICGINEVLGGMLKGMRRPFMPTLATLTFMCGLRFIWVQWIYPLFPNDGGGNLTYLYLVWPVGWILCIMVLSVTYFIAMSKIKKETL